MEISPWYWQEFIQAVVQDASKNRGDVSASHWKDAGSSLDMTIRIFIRKGGI